MSRTVDINIMGHRLQIRSDSDEEYVAQVAAFVDGKVKDILSKTKSVASSQVLILAAMNIADEFIKHKNTNKAKRDEIAKKIESVIEHIDLRL